MLLQKNTHLQSQGWTWCETCSSFLLNQSTLFFVLLLALFIRLPHMLTFLTALLPGCMHQYMPTNEHSNFLFLSRRLCIAEPAATWLSSTGFTALRSLIFSFSSSEFFAAVTNLYYPPPTRTELLAHAKAPPFLWHGSSSRLQFFLFFAFLSFLPEVFIYNFPSTSFENPPLTCFLPTHLSWLLHLRA